MQDVAALGFSIDSSQAVLAATNLDQMSMASKRAEEAQKSQQQATQQLTNEMAKIIEAQKRQIDELRRLEESYKSAQNTSAGFFSFVTGALGAIVSGAADATVGMVNLAEHGFVYATQKFKEFDDAVGDYFSLTLPENIKTANNELKLMSQIAGTNKESFRDFKTVLDGVGISVTQQLQLMSRLAEARQQSTGVGRDIADTLRGMGIEPQFAKDELDLLRQINKEMQNTADGRQKLILYQKIYGQVTAETLKLEASGIRELTKEEELLNQLRAKRAKMTLDETEEEKRARQIREREGPRQTLGGIFDEIASIERIGLANQVNKTSFNPLSDAFFGDKNIENLKESARKFGDTIQAESARILNNMRATLERAADEYDNQGFWGKLLDTVNPLTQKGAMTRDRANFFGGLADMLRPDIDTSGNADTRASARLTPEQLVSEFDRVYADIRRPIEDFYSWSADQDVKFWETKLSILENEGYRFTDAYNQILGRLKEATARNYAEQRTLEAQEMAKERIQFGGDAEALLRAAKERQERARGLLDKGQLRRQDMASYDISVLSAERAATQQGFAISNINQQTERQVFEARKQQISEEADFAVRTYQITNTERVKLLKKFVEEQYTLETAALQAQKDQADRLGQVVQSKAAEAGLQIAKVRKDIELSRLDRSQTDQQDLAIVDEMRSARMRQTRSGAAGQIPEARKLAEELERIDQELISAFGKNTELYKKYSEDRSNFARQRVSQESQIDLKTRIGDMQRELEITDKMNAATLRGSQAVSEYNIQKEVEIQRARLMVGANEDERESIEKLVAEYEKLLRKIEQRKSFTEASALRERFNPGVARDQAVDRLEQLRKENPNLIDGDTYRRRMEEIEEAYRQQEIAILSASRNAMDGAKAAFLEYSNFATNSGRQAQIAFSSSISRMEDSIVEFSRTGQLNFRQLIDGMLADLIRFTTRQSITGPLFNWLGGQMGTGGLFNFGGGAAGASAGAAALSDSQLTAMGMGMFFANGGVFRGGNVVPFADGGIVNSPTMFPMSGGRTGLMGEAGEEAIMPLRRGPNGKLGIAASGGGTSITNNFNVVVQTQGGGQGASPEAGKQIGEDITRQLRDMVVEILVQQQRPGATLNPGFS